MKIKYGADNEGFMWITSMFKTIERFAALNSEGDFTQRRLQEAKSLYNNFKKNKGMTEKQVNKFISIKKALSPQLR